MLARRDSSPQKKKKKKKEKREKEKERKEEKKKRKKRSSKGGIVAFSCSNLNVSMRETRPRPRSKLDAR